VADVGLDSSAQLAQLAARYQAYQLLGMPSNDRTLCAAASLAAKVGNLSCLGCGERRQRRLQLSVGGTVRQSWSAFNAALKPAAMARYVWPTMASSALVTLCS
jgi:hypothetical protein